MSNTTINARQVLEQLQKLDNEGGGGEQSNSYWQHWERPRNALLAIEYGVEASSFLTMAAASSTAASLALMP